MSLLGKKWVVKDQPLSALLNSTLDNEAVTFHDPFLFKDMEKAVARIERSLATNERVLIFGDYDVDGISGTALLVHTLRALGANVSYRLPTRKDGYGINPKWIDEFAALEVGVLVTVDCGVSNAAEIADAASRGIDVIITDHHALPATLPQAHALLHPNLPGDTYPFHELSGSAVAYKFAVALMHRIKGEEAGREWKHRLVDLASLGTVADCMPLVGENRWIVKNGLDQMRHTEWEGLKILLQNAGVDQIVGYDSDIIGFRLGPRINASGRMQSPVVSLQVLLNENGAAAALAQKLESFNLERRVSVEVALETAEIQIREHNRLEKNLLIAWHEDWSAGIIGLLAARLSEKYHRPAIVMENRGHELVASCRSPEFFNIVHALTACRDHLKTFGGHAGAAGFTISTEQLPGFLEAIEAATTEVLKDKDLTPTLTVDYEVNLEDLTVELAARLATFEPYGVGNLRPKFLLRSVRPVDLQTVGRERSHVRFQVKEGERQFSAIAFRFGDHYTTLQRAISEGSGTLDVVFEVERNVWNGRERIQLKVVDMAPTIDK